MIVVMSEEKETKITLKSDKATGVSSRAYGANIDAVAFNLTYLAKKNPVLAATILKNYKDAAAVSQYDPEHPDEDFGLASENIQDLLK